MVKKNVLWKLRMVSLTTYEPKKFRSQLDANFDKLADEKDY